MKLIKNICLILLFALAIFGLSQVYFKYNSLTENHTTESSEVLLEKIQTVMKLIAVEGQFSEIYNYKDYVLTDLWPFRKSALIRVNAKVSVGYDLEDLKIDIDNENRIMRISEFPEAEILSIEHDLEYYDMQQGLFNVITTEDVTDMSKKAKSFIEEKALKSELFSIAKSQKMETSKMLNYIFQNSGWTLEMDESLFLD